MRVSFIGAGNVAWHLSEALENAGHIVLEIYSRDARNARKLAQKLYDTIVVNDLDFSESEAEIVFLTVPDDAIKEVVEQLILPENSLLVHTSGTKTLDELRKFVEIYGDVPTRTGVFYPLQTFSKETDLNIGIVPICIEASDKNSQEQLIDLAQDISQTVYLVNSEERKVLHLAAVFACNFTNNLLAVAKKIVEDEDLEFALLKPLIEETIKKALQNDPAQVQTGPAKRNDRKTMKAHLQYLEGQPQLQSIYELLSQNIRDFSS